MYSNKLKLILKMVLYLLMAFVCQQISQDIFPQLMVYPDFFFVLIWTFAYLYEIEWSMILAISAGIIRDVLFGQIFGLSIILGILGMYLSRHLLQFIWQKRFVFLPIQIMLMSVIIKFLEIFALNVIGVFQFRQNFSLLQVKNSFATQIILYSILNVAAMLICYLLLAKILPFIKLKKDVYAEDRLNIKGEF